MKKRSDRLGRVKRLADCEERNHCRAMGNAQRTLESQLERLEELQNYRRDYSGRQPRGGSISSTQWADYQNFLYRLDEAVAAQSQLVMDGRQSRDAHRQRWMVKRQKVESLQRVVERSRDAEFRHGERVSQKIQDELPATADPFRRR
jgi:flagellar FliJ protein